MRILLTNDDGIYAPGLEALLEELKSRGEVQVVAPAVQQSGVGHSITYLQPLIAEEIFRHQVRFGHAVAGSPADCVKLAVLELCPQRPDLVVSGINSGSNVGINVLYSGTVAAAIEGAFFGITSVAVSLASNGQPDYAQAARYAVQIIDQLLRQNVPAGSLWNINLPESRPDGPRGVKVLPMDIEREGECMETRRDPRGRTYYWSASKPVPKDYVPETDVGALAQNYATLTPLHFDLTQQRHLSLFDNVEWSLK